MLGIFSKRPQSPEPIETTPFYSVQRLISHKTAWPQFVEEPKLYMFGEIFRLDYMGASEFEGGAFASFMREVKAHFDTLQAHQLDIDGMSVFVVFSAHNNTLEHVKGQLEGIASKSIRTHYGSGFQKAVPKEAGRKPRKGSKAERAAQYDEEMRIDAWAEISLCAFWTTLPMTLEQYKALITASVVKMDAAKAQNDKLGGGK